VRFRVVAALALGALALPRVSVAEVEEIVVTAARVEQEASSLPLAVSVIGSDDIQRRQLLGLDESLNRVPGMFFSNRYNFSRDLRISIRGFGARANFGVRGIKVYVDGIPSTAADGQTSLDDLDLSAVDRIEVIRGPSSALYGASAGGVINIFTEEGPETPFVEAGGALGDYGFDRYQLKAGGQAGPLNYFVNGSYLHYDGYRDHSEVEQGTVSGKLRYAFGDGSIGQLIVRAADSPQADDAGGLNTAEVAADRRQARLRNVQLDAGEAVKEQKLGLSWEKSWGESQLTLRNYYNWRDFDAKLPLTPALGTGVVHFDRFFLGGGGQYSNTTPLFGLENRVTLGFEADSMTDDRQRWDNLNGTRGPLGFDQDEIAHTVGVYLQEELALGERVHVQAGARYDHIRYEVEDHFFANGDQSASLTFDEVSPMVGLAFNALDALTLYANYSTSFETPTFTELANPADNGTLGGFANVAAQRANGFELGVKGVVSQRVRYELAYYDMHVQDEVTTVTNVGGRAFFNNADTDRKGVEIGVVAEPLPGLTLTGAYTFTDLTFDRFPSNTAAEGNTLPGVPRHTGYAEIAYSHDVGFWAKWDWSHVGSLYADNLNTVRVDEYDVSNLVVGWDVTLGAWTVTPSLGVNNLFEERYNQEIRIEDSTARYYEPAPDRNIYGGVRFRFDFGAGSAAAASRASARSRAKSSADVDARSAWLTRDRLPGA
jgi:iron complex outermembrane receptor protein